MKIDRLIEILKQEYPEDTAIEKDKIGLQVYTGNENINRILISMELNPRVVDEALENHCNCILAFHPLIFRPLEIINIQDRVGNILYKLVKSDISLFIIHTNFDSYPFGTNYIFASKLGLKPVSVLYPDENFEGYGLGLIARTDRPLTEEELLEKISTVCNSPLKYCNGRKSEGIVNIGIICGSGSSLLKDEFSNQCEAFITADVSYHTFHRFEGKMMLIDPGHYEMEQFVPEALAKSLLNKYNNELPEIILSNIYTNPIKYYPDTNEYINRQINYRLINKWE